MKTEELKAQGLTDEQINFIMAENGNDIKKVKADLDSVKAENAAMKTQKEQLESQVKERDAQLSDLKNSAGDNEQLRKKILELEEVNKVKEKEHSEILKATLKEQAVNEALLKAKAKNVNAVRGLIDDSLVRLDGRAVSGLEEQLKKIKESDSYLFDSEGGVTAQGRAVKGASGSLTTTTKEEFEKMSYAERAEIFQNSPENYRTLRGE